MSQKKLGHCVSSSFCPHPSATAAWVGKLDSVLYGKLAAVGLVPTREPTPDVKPQDTELGPFLDA